MATKVLQSRLQLKYDTLSNWLNSTFIPLSGEVCIATVPTGTTTTGVIAPPATLMKIGDGTNKFADLPWLQAVSSDIYEWAKASTKPTYNASEIVDLSSFIAGKVQDTNTTYQLVQTTGNEYEYVLQAKELGATKWTTVSTLTIPNETAQIEALEELVGSTAVSTQITNAINALDATAVTAGTGKVIDSVSQVNGVVSATTRSLVKGDIPTIDQSQVSGLATSLAAKQDNLTFDGTYNATSNKVATQNSVTNAINALDKSDTAIAAQLVSAVSQTNGVISVSRRALVKADIPTIDQSQVSGLADSLAAKQDVLGFEGNYNKSTNKVVTKSYLDTMIADLNGAMHFEGVITGDTFDAAIGDTVYSAGDVVLYGVDEYVYDGQDWHVLGNENIYALKATVASDIAAAKTSLTTEINKKQNTLTFDGTYNASTNKAATVSTVTNAVNALDKSDTAVAKQLVSAVSQSNGVITVSRRALVADDIPTLAQSKISGLETALSNKQATVSFDGTYSATDNKAATVSTVTNAINALDKSDTAVSKQFVTAVSQTNGVINISRAQPAASDISGLAAIATSGNVNDLVQTSGDVIVFQCGSSTVNI